MIQETSESPDFGVIAVTTDSNDPPSRATQEVESSFEGSAIAPDKIVAIASLNPQQGLLVSFSTAVQTFRTHLLTVLALGLLGVSLFFVDLTRDDQAKEPEGLPHTQGGWWFSS